MIGLLRIIFIFGIIYIIYRFLTRYLFPLLLGNFINHKMSQMNGDFQRGKREKPQREGEIIIEKVPDKKKHYTKNTGDYVDFEEIKE
jgi:hypothetical protein